MCPGPYEITGQYTRYEMDRMFETVLILHGASFGAVWVIWGCKNIGLRMGPGILHGTILLGCCLVQLGTLWDRHTAWASLALHGCVFVKRIGNLELYEICMNPLKTVTVCNTIMGRCIEYCKDRVGLFWTV